MKTPTVIIIVVVVVIRLRKNSYAGKYAEN